MVRSITREILSALSQGPTQYKDIRRSIPNVSKEDFDNIVDNLITRGMIEIIVKKGPILELTEKATNRRG